VVVPATVVGVVVVGVAVVGEVDAGVVLVGPADGFDVEPHAERRPVAARRVTVVVRFPIRSVNQKGPAPMLSTGPIFQLCWVVEDIAAAENLFVDHYGVERWMRIPEVRFPPESCTYRGRPADFTVHVSLGYAGGQQLELIEPVAGSNIYVEHLERHGPGLHHVAWIPEDFDRTVDEAVSAGFEIAQRGSMGDVGMEFAYIEGGPVGTCVEVMRLSDTIRQIFDSLIPTGFKNPWQP
jgi:hypothetical protein